LIKNLEKLLNHRHVFLLFTVFIGLSVFPSWLGLTELLKGAFPDLFSRIGPLNPLKMIIPFLLIWLFFNRTKIRWPALWTLGAFVGLGTIFTMLSGKECADPSLHYREWAAISVGLVAAVTLSLFPTRYIRVIVRMWAGTVILAVLLNYFFPDTLTWINQTLFDPKRVVSNQVYGVTLLNGFYDIGSMAKLLMWTPWVWLWAESLDHPTPFSLTKKGMAILLFAASLFLILLTTQRGPLVGQISGVLTYFFFRSYARKEYRNIGVVIASLGVFVGLSLLFMPKALYERRIQPLFTLHQATEESMSANPNMSSLQDRLHIFQVSWRVVKENPMGMACVPDSYFSEANASLGTHSHNVFLHQTRSRGWVWGVLNLIFWILAFLFLARKKSESTLLALGGLTSTVALSLVDYPWFVLNHSIIMGIFLLGATVFEERPKNTNP
jgi:hypothetical protein